MNDLFDTSSLLILQGFGEPIKDVLLKYCHNHFDEVFQTAVQHIEKTAEIIIENKLLSPDTPEPFNKVFTLSICLCCNAIIFATAGIDMVCFHTALLVFGSVYVFDLIIHTFHRTFGK